MGRTAPRHALLLTRIARRREAAGLSQQDLADLVGYGVATIRRLERGEVFDPGIRQLSLIAEALRCNIEDLVEPAWKTRDGTFSSGDST